MNMPTIYSIARLRISPSCATDAIKTPSLVNRLPRVSPLAPEAEGLSWV
jgi:hypothetical protein